MDTTITLDKRQPRDASPDLKLYFLELERILRVLSIKQPLLTNSYFMDGTAKEIVVSGAGEYYEIGVPDSGGWGSTFADGLTVSSSGVITNDSGRPLVLSVNGSLTVAKTGGGSDRIEARLAVDWDGTVSDSGLYETKVETDSATPATVPVNTTVLLNNGSNLRGILKNIDGAANILVSSAQLNITSVTAVGIDP